MQYKIRQKFHNLFRHQEFTRPQTTLSCTWFEHNNRNCIIIWQITIISTQNLWHHMLQLLETLNQMHFQLLTIWYTIKAQSNEEDAMDCSRWRKLTKDVWWSGWMWVGDLFLLVPDYQVCTDKRPLTGCVFVQNSVQVINNVTIQQTAYNFLLACPGNYMWVPILLSFYNMVQYSSTFFTLLSTYCQYERATLQWQMPNSSIFLQCIIKTD